MKRLFGVLLILPTILCLATTMIIGVYVFGTKTFLIAFGIAAFLTVSVILFDKGMELIMEKKK